MQAEKIYSKTDATIKYIIPCQNQPVEFSLIRKGDGKDIICVPTQTSCNLGCNFCFLTGSGIPVINLTVEDICKGVAHIIEDAVLPSREAHTLLISYMGSGEPLCNRNVVVEASRALQETYQKRVGSRKFQIIRFAVASMIPNLKWMQQFTDLIQETGLRMKFHFSLHGTTDEARRRLMPLAAEIKPSLEAVATYRGKTGNPIEVHYSLNEDNDDDKDIINLRELLLTYMIPIKFLAYKERPGAPRASERITRFQNSLTDAGLSVEYYDPPGSDIGSSCGQFLLHRNTK